MIDFSQIIEKPVVIRCEEMWMAEAFFNAALEQYPEKVPHGAELSSVVSAFWNVFRSQTVYGIGERLFIDCVNNCKDKFDIIEFINLKMRQ